jgi:glutamine amidotransferase
MSNILIVDYGMGNLRSVYNAVKLLGYEATVDSSTKSIAHADRIILPGVGAFGDAMDRIRRLELDKSLTEAIEDQKKRILGICLGAQLICRESDEFGLHEGLGWIDARVESFHKRTTLNVPHVGWNNLTIKQPCSIFENIESPDFYFVHSFHLVCKNVENILATCDYGITFPAVVKNKNVIGTQFHPEKSQKSGLTLLKNFIEGVNA